MEEDVQITRGEVMEELYGEYPEGELDDLEMD